VVDRILCLANSYKHDHRCVAGVSLISKRWVRLVGRIIPGCLTIREASYSDGRELRLLDIFEAEIGESCASSCHPEDVYLDTKPLQFLERYDQPRHASKLKILASKGQSVLQGPSDRIYGKKIQSYPVDHSIELVRPDDLWWWIRDEAGKRRNRALFRVGHPNRLRYDLAVTDPAWLRQLNLLAPGIYPHAMLIGGQPSHTLLTASLSEPFEGFHYKLIAGVVTLPESPKATSRIAADSRTR
jgi:hypothetical protein